ncbi:MAG: hypothetical protein IH597_06755 [Bacteroidales bacterium]|nr:hypothetical protein [Bacteroidales bacterium]
MKSNTVIERFGGLIKEEPLTCLSDETLQANTCVLESVSPFFGYYNHEPKAQKPQYLYFPLNGYFSLETISRATQNIRKKFRQPYDMVTGNITLFGVTSQVIRIRNLEYYNHISTLQSLYLDEGITFSNKFRKANNVMAMIKLRKFFFLEPIEEDIFIDKAQQHHAYFLVPEQIDWERFKSLTEQVKYDPIYFYFDGAIAFIYHNGDVKDMIRIYRENFALNEIKAIKRKYIDLLKR